MIPSKLCAASLCLRKPLVFVSLLCKGGGLDLISSSVYYGIWCVHALSIWVRICPTLVIYPCAFFSSIACQGKSCAICDHDVLVLRDSSISLILLCRAPGVRFVLSECKIRLV